MDRSWVLTAARLQVVKDLLDHGLEIAKASHHKPPVYVVKQPVENPLLLAILALEGTVMREVLPGLDKADVRAYDLRFWMLSGEFYGPDASTGAYVENINHLSDRCYEQLVS